MIDITNKQDIIKALNSGVITVTFMKADGTLRTIKGTTNIDLIPPSHRPVVNEESDTESKPKKPRPENLISIFSLEDLGWRSFKLETVKEINQ